MRKRQIFPQRGYRLTPYTSVLVTAEAIRIRSATTAGRRLPPVPENHGVPRRCRLPVLVSSARQVAAGSHDTATEHFCFEEVFTGRPFGGSIFAATREALLDGHLRSRDATRGAQPVPSGAAAGRRRAESVVASPLRPGHTSNDLWLMYEDDVLDGGRGTQCDCFHANEP